MVLIKCKRCGKWKEHRARGLCKNCYSKYMYSIHREKRLKQIKENWIIGCIVGKRFKVYTNGYTEQLRPLVPKIKNQVLNDCIKNPRKYLGDSNG